MTLNDLNDWLVGKEYKNLHFMTDKEIVLDVNNNDEKDETLLIKSMPYSK